MYKYVLPGEDDKMKKEVLDYIVALYKKDKNIELNFRSYQNSVQARLVNPEEWKEMVQLIVGYKR